MVCVCVFRCVWGQRVCAARLHVEDQVVRLPEHSESILQTAAASVPKPGELPWQPQQRILRATTADKYRLRFKHTELIWNSDVLHVFLCRTCRRAVGVATCWSRRASPSSRPTRTNSPSPRVTSSAWAGRRRGAGGRGRSTASLGGSPATTCGSWKEAVGEAVVAPEALHHPFVRVSGGKWDVNFLITVYVKFF